ncbi:NTPase KAP [Pseudonocardia sp. TMWB2A]|uniref:KAP family P-loop NTPase fold protein n=1 Tax=Pseudonocardia sp. TMWB2A TaxID=687430 RepID=UPI00307DA094
MWADNETEVDLLGFGFLVDTLVVALTERRLLPLTVGLLGDWGSGKSSLMKIARKELEGFAEGGETPSRYLCVDFSPWQYEDYDDVKVALMTTVLDAVSERVPAEQQEQVSRLRGLARGLGRLGRRGGRAVLSTAGAATPLALQAIDPTLDPSAVEVGTALVQAGASEAAKALRDPTTPSTPEGPAGAEPIVDAGAFRDEFTRLVSGLDDVDAVVVFIDDLDRCLPPTVVDTFEAIRLFLNTPKTAYVLALNQAVVESAIDSRYPQLRRANGTGIGADYLEKMLQLRVVVPTLSAPEADTYANLLLAELHLGADEFAAVLAKTQARRAAGNLHVAFNLGFARDDIAAVPGVLVRDLDWAASISEILGSGLRGNPRQLKRFLNNLLLRHRSAERRGIELDLPVLAKLMALEEQHLADFQRLFDWQLTNPGPISQLAMAESHARRLPAPPPEGDGVDAETPEEPPKPKPVGKRDRGTRPAAVPEDVTSWLEKPHIRTWLGLEPPLGSVDLAPYFTYSRGRLAFGVALTRLPPHLQDLVSRIQSESGAVRRLARTQIVELQPDERGLVVEAVLEAVARRPGSSAFGAAVEIADQAPDSLKTICDALTGLPPDAIPPLEAGKAVRRLPADEAVVAALFDRWEQSGIPRLASVVGAARKAQQAGGRG